MDDIVLQPFETAYPTLPVGGETAVVDAEPGDAGEAVACVCGNDISSDGFSTAGPDGRFASMMLGDTPEGLSGDDGFSICNACGRVYDDSHLLLGGGTRVPVIAHYDPDSAEFIAARDLYCKANFGE